MTDIEVHGGGGGGAVTGGDGGVGVSIATAGNTAGTMAALSAGTVSLYGGANITLSQNGSSIISIVGAGAGTNLKALYDGANSASSGTISLANANGVTFSLNANTLSASVAAAQTNLKALYDGANSASSGTISLANANGVTFSLNANTLSASINAPAPVTISRFMANSLYNSIGSVIIGQTKVSLFPMILPNYLSFTRVDVPMSVSYASAANNSTANVAASGYLVLYTRNASTLNPVIGTAYSQTISWVSNSSNYVSGNALYSLPFAGSLSPGNYFVGWQFSTSSGFTAAGGATTALDASFNPWFPANNQFFATGAWMDMVNGTTNAVSNELFGWAGLNSVTLTATAQTHQISQMTMTGATMSRAILMPIFRNV